MAKWNTSRNLLSSNMLLYSIPHVQWEISVKNIIQGGADIISYNIYCLIYNRLLKIQRLERTIYGEGEVSATLESIQM